ncbi:hypothetical protein, partial [Leptolyngbya sp. FACHB-16]|uniref:hypothetical protein n=2 Tax=unclassified Leptolyngbya TaxID=2650499 RepID=UPI001A7E6E34
MFDTVSSDWLREMDVELRPTSISLSHSHFGIQSENSPPSADYFRASKLRVRARRARTLSFEAHIAIKSAAILIL